MYCKYNQIPSKKFLELSIFPREISLYLTFGLGLGQSDMNFDGSVGL